MHFQSEALVLRCIDFGESDRIVHLLVPDGGRVTAIAKGARRSVRRFSGTLDLFHHLRIQTGRRRPNAMVRLEQATLLESFSAIRRDPARFALACYLMELFDRLAPEGGARADTARLFAFARRALCMLAEQSPDPRVRTLLELRALDALGLRPELRACVRCGDTFAGRTVVDFHVADGGPVCGACGARRDGLLPVHLGTLRALEQGLRFDLERLRRLALGPAMLAEAAVLLSRFQRFHLGVELRSQRFLDEVLSPGPPTGAP